MTKPLENVRDRGHEDERSSVPAGRDGVAGSAGDFVFTFSLHVFWYGEARL